MTFPTYGSVFACILLSSVFMIVVCLLGNRINFILKNSANLLVFFMIMVMLRMFFPCNFVFTKNIYSTRALTVICDILMKHIWKDYSVSDVIIVVWILISFMYICKLIYTQIQFNRFLSILVPDNSNKIEKAYKSVQNNKNYKFEIYKIQGIKSPCITGLIHPKILLPEMDFTEKELQYIFKHELQHFNHHDLWLNMLCEIIMCFYWWNPFAYFLKEKFKKLFIIFGGS